MTSNISVPSVATAREAPARRFLGRRAVRFALVGSVNTAIDFGLFALLTVLGVPIFAANAVSTSCGLLFSYFANRRFTFGVEHRHDLRGVLLFVGVTGTGLWIVQPLVILGVMAVLPAGLPLAVAAGIGKIAGIAVGLVWNFVLYKRIVFRGQ